MKPISSRPLRDIGTCEGNDASTAANSVMEKRATLSSGAECVPEQNSFAVSPDESPLCPTVACPRASNSEDSATEELRRQTDWSHRTFRPLVPPLGARSLLAKSFSARPTPDGWVIFPPGRVR